MGRKECALHRRSASQGWTLVSPQPPSLRPTLERHSSGRRNKRVQRAEVLCLLSKMNQTLQKLGFSSAGCAAFPHHIPTVLPSPLRPQALHYSDSFDSLISASWRLPGLLRRAGCPGTGPAGHSLASADEGGGDRKQGPLKDWVSGLSLGPRQENASPNPKEMVYPVPPFKWLLGV